MKAMILAGGLSTRLYPLTRQVPKPLVPIAGEPSAVHIMRYLKQFGIEDIAINVHYLAEMVEQRLGTGASEGVRLHYLRERELMGSAGAVKQMERFFDDTFVVIGCDDLTDARLDVLIDFHQRRQATATIALVERKDVEHYGVVVIDEYGKIDAFQEKPARGTEHSNLANTGIYVFDPAVFRHIPANTFVDFGKDVFPALLRSGEGFYGLHMHTAYWRDIGTPEEYRRATADVLDGTLILPGARAKGIAADARGVADIAVTGDVRIGNGARLGYGVRIVGPTSIGDRCVIGDDVTVERSILWDGVTIGANAKIADAIIGNGYRVLPRQEIFGEVVANEGPIGEPAAAPEQSPSAAASKTARR